MRSSFVTQRAVTEHQLADTDLWLQRSCYPDDHETGDAEGSVFLDGNPRERCSRAFENRHPDVWSNPVDVGLSIQSPGVLPREVSPPAATEDKD